MNRHSTRWLEVWLSIALLLAVIVFLKTVGGF